MARQPLVMMDADLAAKRGLPILGCWRGMQLGSVHPEEMSIAITPAIRKADGNITVSAMAMSICGSCTKPMPSPRSTTSASCRRRGRRTNVNGGAIALGHPIWHERHPLSRLDADGTSDAARRRTRIVGVCTAGGMATAALLVGCCMRGSRR
jgi:acetyl-CoA C-acetyltransferase